MRSINNVAMPKHDTCGAGRFHDRGDCRCESWYCSALLFAESAARDRDADKLIFWRCMPASKES